MKGMFFSSILVACLLLASGFALRAQTNPPMQSIQQHYREQPPGQVPNIAGVAIGGPYGVLTDEQRVSYQALMKAARGKLVELESKLRAAHQDVVATSVTAPFDENLMREKALAAAQIEAEMVVLRAKVYSQVQPPLSPEQIEKVKSGQPGPPRPFERQIEHPLRRASPAVTTNQDANGLPPKQ